ncbi:NADAR family protein [Phenylobacterium sp.]|uniref:NADAR family protein n=1 Tax=Phenylobacterium sp. TaxID=1871053 RepID=UPI0037C53AAF
MVSIVSSQDELKMSEAEIRRYRRDEVIAFRKTGDAFGGLSNMAPGFPIFMLGQRIRTAEALYQSCRFPHLPQVQRMILNETSPMTAKMRSKPYRDKSRPDWNEVRVPVMKWCLRAKLAANWRNFSELLLESGDRPIVEDSRKDDFWGAKSTAEGWLEGRNVLGRLLMELREKLKVDPASLHSVRPLPIIDFVVLSQPIGTIEMRESVEQVHHRTDYRKPAYQAGLI